jgi:hypothetical protein
LFCAVHQDETFPHLTLMHEVPGSRILRTSPFGDSAKFAFTEFYEVRQESIKYHSFA